MTQILKSVLNTRSTKNRMTYAVNTVSSASRKLFQITLALALTPQHSGAPCSPLPRVMM